MSRGHHRFDVAWLTTLVVLGACGGHGSRAAAPSDGAADSDASSIDGAIADVGLADAEPRDASRSAEGGIVVGRADAALDSGGARDGGDGVCASARELCAGDPDVEIDCASFASAKPSTRACVSAARTCDGVVACVLDDLPDAGSADAGSCGATSSCAESGLVPGDSFLMGRCGAAGEACSDAYDGLASELPEHQAKVSDFRLDAYEVTVARFRAFAQAYAAGWRPSVGAGEHPLLADSGWSSDWDSLLPNDEAALASSVKCNATYETWTDVPGAREQHPINCVDWYQAFAFCIWDGGRLPTEAEWEFAAAGGADNRLYPWGAEAPDRSRAIYDCLGDGSAAGQCAASDIVPVGSAASGRGRYGQYDLAGSVWEWVLDWHGAYSATPCDDCARLTGGSARVLRGGTWDHPPGNIRSVNRSGSEPDNRNAKWGFRCAR